MYADDAAEAVFTVCMELHLQNGGQSDAFLTLLLPAIGEQLPDTSSVREYVGEDGISCRETQDSSQQWKISWLDGSVTRPDAAGEGAGT